MPNWRLAISGSFRRSSRISAGGVPRESSEVHRGGTEHSVAETGQNAKLQREEPTASTGPRSRRIDKPPPDCEIGSR